jgi:hypothetical protein
LAIVVPGRSWLEISLWKTGKDRKKEKEHTRKERERKKERKKERREMVSKQPSSTAEIR